ncbi:MAG: hypothetical protein WKH64_06065 [Chloroflexia bacterium]
MFTWAGRYPMWATIHGVLVVFIAASTRRRSRPLRRLGHVVLWRQQRTLRESGTTAYPSTLRAVLLAEGGADGPVRGKRGRGPALQTYGLTETASQAVTLSPRRTDPPAVGRPTALAHTAESSATRVCRRSQQPGDMAERLSPPDIVTRRRRSELFGAGGFTRATRVTSTTRLLALDRGRSDRYGRENVPSRSEALSTTPPSPTRASTEFPTRSGARRLSRPWSCGRTRSPTARHCAPTY